MNSVSFERINTWPKRIIAGILVILFLAASVFLTAGLLPVKKAYIGEHHSCYVMMEDGTKLAVRYTLPTGLKEGERVPAIMEVTRYGTESNERPYHFLCVVFYFLRTKKCGILKKSINHCEKFQRACWIRGFR
jgi:hypothetical protein